MDRPVCLTGTGLRRDPSDEGCGEGWLPLEKGWAGRVEWAFLEQALPFKKAPHRNA